MNIVKFRVKSLVKGVCININEILLLVLYTCVCACDDINCVCIVVTIYTLVCLADYTMK